MSGKIERRLADLGISLPTAAPPAANYVPARRVGCQVYISGQVPSEVEAIFEVV
jgi:enamine deaminase RidA (YjgF/YER057c/UK114 family)